MHRYVLALGSNRAFSSVLPPARLLEAATRAVDDIGRVVARAPVILTPPLGPSQRRYANGALLIETALAPAPLLARLQGIERALGRQRHRRWGARRIDIDIILWSGGRWRARALTIPHPAFRARAFVLRPLMTIAADWRDPVTGLMVRHLHARGKKPRPPEVDQRPSPF